MFPIFHRAQSESDVANDFPDSALLCAGSTLKHLLLYKILWWFVHRLAVSIRIDRLENGEDGHFVRGLTVGEAKCMSYKLCN